jgi:hypothetical protein
MYSGKIAVPPGGGGIRKILNKVKNQVKGKWKWQLTQYPDFI